MTNDTFMKYFDKSLYSRFCAFEHENQLLDSFYSRIWEGIRFDVYFNLNLKCKNIQIPHDQVVAQTFRKNNYVSYSLNVFKAYLVSKIFYWKNIKYHKVAISWLFWGHSRRKLESDGLYWDIYSDPLIINLKFRHNYLVCENQYQGSHLKPAKTDNIFYPDYMSFELALHKLFLRKRLYSDEVQEYFQNIEEDLNFSFDVSINIVQMAQNYAASYQFRCKQYSKFLRKIRPKILFIVVGYGRESLIRAAKELYIPVVELQHGVLSKYHLGYDVSSGKKKDFADYFFSFGPAWGQMAHFPIPQEKIIPIGYQYLNTAANKYQKVEKKKQILFLSQGTIGDRLSEFAVELAKKIPADIRVIYKLHPGEYMRWKTEYKALLQAFEDGLIDVITGDEPSLYQLQAQSKWQIGVNSTALFEGMVFKCKTYIVDLPGIEDVETLINNNEFILVQKPEQIEFTYDPDELKYRTEDYFSQDTESKFKAAIDFVMKDYYA